MEAAILRDNDVEILLNDMLDRYGYDFTDYTKASLKRRITRLMSIDGFPSFAEFRFRLQKDRIYFDRFVEEITVNVTEMFRDPSFYTALRQEVIPKLAAHPLIRIWHAGCSTGEEVYSMAILLKEAGLLHKSIMYATDINPDVLEKARKGLFALGTLKLYSENYIASGGQADFSSYYTAKYGWAKFDTALTRKMVFATHNLVSDGSFNEFQLILCRNVLIYFDKVLQDKVLSVFDQSLEPLGFLALGAKETLRFSTIITRYRQLNKDRIWRKIE